MCVFKAGVLVGTNNEFFQQRLLNPSWKWCKSILTRPPMMWLRKTKRWCYVLVFSLEMMMIFNWSFISKDDNDLKVMLYFMVDLISIVTLLNQIWRWRWRLSWVWLEAPWVFSLGSQFSGVFIVFSSNMIMISIWWSWSNSSWKT